MRNKYKEHVHPPTGSSSKISFTKQGATAACVNVQLYSSCIVCVCAGGLVISSKTSPTAPISDVDLVALVAFDSDSDVEWDSSLELDVAVAETTVLGPPLFVFAFWGIRLVLAWYDTPSFLLMFLWCDNTLREVEGCERCFAERLTLSIVALTVLRFSLEKIANATSRSVRFPKYKVQTQISKDKAKEEAASNEK